MREISSCSCLTVLPGPAWVLLSKTYKPLFTPLYMVDENVPRRKSAVCDAMAFNCAAPPSRPPSPPTFFVPFPGCLPLPPSLRPSSIPFPFSPLCATKLRSLALSGAARARGGRGPFRGTSGYSARRRATGWHNLVAGRDMQSWDASTLFCVHLGVEQSEGRKNACNSRILQVSRSAHTALCQAM